MTSITHLNADYRFQHARTSADSLGNNSDRVRAHIEIAQRDPEHDFFWAKRRACTHNGTGFDLMVQRSLLREIAAAEACFNLAAAKVTAGSIDDPSERELAYMDIIKIEAGSNIEAAKITAEANIKDPLRKDRAARYIAVTLAKDYPEAGKAMASSIRDPFYRQEALSEIEAQQKTT